MIDIDSEADIFAKETAQVHGLQDRTELRAARLLAAVVREELPTARYLGMERTDQGGLTLICREVLDENRQVLAASVYDLNGVDDMEHYAGWMTDGGTWTLARARLEGRFGDYLDLDLAAELEPYKAP